MTAIDKTAGRLLEINLKKHPSRSEAARIFWRQSRRISFRIISRTFGMAAPETLFQGNIFHQRVSLAVQLAPKQGLIVLEQRKLEKVLQKCAAISPNKDVRYSRKGPKTPLDGL